jgi:hypothetical protein
MCFAQNAECQSADRRKFADFLGKSHAKYRTKSTSYSFSGVKRQYPGKKPGGIFQALPEVH